MEPDNCYIPSPPASLTAFVATKWHNGREVLVGDNGHGYYAEEVRGIAAGDTAEAPRAAALLATLASA